MKNLVILGSTGSIGQNVLHAIRHLGKITVIAPEQNHSGASNSLTLSRPLSIHRVAGGERDGFMFINGTPTDCVHIAMTGFLDEKPDLVVSGINQGENMGEDVLYSGTVAAAIEGVMFGVPGIAFSQIDRGWSKLDDVKVLEIRGKAATGQSKPSLAAEYGVTRQAIGHIINGKTWKHVKL